MLGSNPRVGLTNLDKGLTYLDMSTDPRPLLARSASLMGFQAVVTEAGHDALALVRAADLPETCLDEPDLKVPTAKLLDLLERGASQTGLEDLGLRMAVKRPFSNLGTFGLVLREQPDVRRVLAAMSSTVWVQTEGVHLRVEESGDLAIVTFAIAPALGRGVRQAVELSAAVAMRVLQRFLGEDWCPDMVLFRHNAPRSAARHRAVFGSVPLFLQDRDALVLRRRDLDTALPESDARTAANLARYLEFVAGARPQDLASQVREVMADLLPSGQCRLERVAEQLNLQPRTLHRRLGERDTRFGTLLQEVRLAAFQRYSQSGDRSFSDMSDLLGFSSLSAFSRWKRHL